MDQHPKTPVHERALPETEARPPDTDAQPMNLSSVRALQIIAKSCKPEAVSEMILGVLRNAHSIPEEERAGVLMILSEMQLECDNRNNPNGATIVNGNMIQANGSQNVNINSNDPHH